MYIFLMAIVPQSYRIQTVASYCFLSYCLCVTISVVIAHAQYSG